MLSSGKQQYIWDFWYTWNPTSHIFTVYFLHAEKKHVKNEQHHFHSSVGVCKTLDWVTFFDYHFNVIQASDENWSNTSIWTGDTFFYKGIRVIFYTSRDKDQDDGMTQSIGLAYDNDQSIQITNTKIIAPDNFYLSKSDPSEKTIHCWRDPYVFEMNNKIYMLVAAKRKDYPINHRGCIALMKLTDSDDLSSWKHIGIIISTDYAEVELPQIYQDSNGKVRIFFNAHSEDGTQHFVMSNDFIFQEAKSDIHTFQDLALDIFERDKFYGYKIIPENNWSVCAFNKRHGTIEIVENLSFLKEMKQIKPILEAEDNKK